MELAVFYLTAVAGVVSAIVAVAHRNPAINVLSLVVTFFCIAVDFALLGAEFLAAAQVLIYAGAILVLFLFVVMLLNAPEEPPSTQPRAFQRAAAWTLTVVAGLGGAALFARVKLGMSKTTAAGSATALGRLLVGPYLFAFELISVVLLAALIGALVLVKRKH